MDAPSRPAARVARCRLVLHGKHAADAALRALVGRVRAGGVDASVRVTWEAGDAARFAIEAAEEGLPLVLAGGGDGTLNEVAGALAALQRDADALPALGVLPLGTANDFATSAAIPADPAAALDLALQAAPRPVDAVRVHAGDVERWFLNVATGGFGTEATVETPDELKRTLGRLAYLLTGLARFG